MTGQPAGKGVVSRLLEDEKRNKNLSDVVDRVNSGKGSKSDKEAVDRAVRSGRVRPPSSSKSKSSETVDSSATNSFDTKAAGKGAAETMAGGGSAMDTVSSGLMMSGNPYAMAAGAALKVVGGVQKKKEAQAKMQADAENQRRARLQDALSRLGSGVGSLGMA